MASGMDNLAREWIGPARHGVAVTPSDTVNLAEPTRGLYVGVSGIVRAILADGDEVILVGLAAGVVHPLRVLRVYATTTTATSIVALW